MTADRAALVERVAREMAWVRWQDHDSNRRIAIPTGWITSIKKVKT